MYGLSTFPAAFYEHVSQHLLSCNYLRCESDPCFFWRRQGEEFLLTVVHVDDFVVAISDMDKVYVASVSPDAQHFFCMQYSDGMAA
jgi:hypothetical protein